MTLVGFIVAMVVGGPANADDGRRSEIVVLVHKATGVAQVSPSELRSLFLGRKTHWDSSTAVVPLMRPVRSPAGDAFFRHAIRMVPTRFRHHWTRLELSGEGVAPQMMEDAQAAARAVARQRGAITFVTREELAALGRVDVRVLEVAANE